MPLSPTICRNFFSLATFETCVDRHLNCKPGKTSQSRTQKAVSLTVQNDEPALLIFLRDHDQSPHDIGPGWIISVNRSKLHELVSQCKSFKFNLVASGASEELLPQQEALSGSVLQSLIFLSVLPIPPGQLSDQVPPVGEIDHLAHFRLGCNGNESNWQIGIQKPIMKFMIQNWFQPSCRVNFTQLNADSEYCTKTRDIHAFCAVHSLQSPPNTFRHMSLNRVHHATSSSRDPSTLFCVLQTLTHLYSVSLQVRPTHLAT